MSFTLMRYKDGVAAPIRMSIWDAFRSSPPPKPARPKSVSAEQLLVIPEPTLADQKSSRVEVDIPVECACCHKIHSASKSEDKVDATDQDKNNKPDEKDDKVKNNKSNEKGGEKGSEKGKSKEEKAAQSSTHDTEIYSKKDDKTITVMKQEGKSWKEILTAIGKESRSQLQAHWKTIDPANKQNAGGKDDQKSEKSDQKDNEDAKKGGQGKDQKQDTNKKAGAAKNGSNKNEKTEQGELKSWSDRYDKQKWIAAASRHFDLTGQRITPAMAKKIANSK